MGFEIVGLTGGIGSGKSTVGRMFAQLGVPVVDADQIARRVVEPGTPGLEAVVEAFGASILSDDGALDRAELGARVFGDAEARRRLESILHPRIAAASGERLSALAKEGHRYALYEAALLVENGSYKMFGRLIVVAVGAETQLARVQARDDLSETAAKKRVRSQLPLEEKIAVADFVIYNDGTLEETRAQVRSVHEILNRGVSSEGVSSEGVSSEGKDALDEGAEGDS